MNIKGLSPLSVLVGLENLKILFVSIIDCGIEIDIGESFWNTTDLSTLSDFVGRL